MSSWAMLGYLMGLMVAVLPVMALAQGPAGYGQPIALEDAKRAAAAAAEVARRKGWSMAISIVDPAGLLVYFEKMDDTQTASIAVSQAKARCAAQFRRPTKAFQDAVAGGGEGLRFLTFEGAVAAEGGVPLVINGKIVGAIGVSGGTSAEDGECAQAAVEALSRK